MSCVSYRPPTISQHLASISLDPVTVVDMFRKFLLFVLETQAWQQVAPSGYNQGITGRTGPGATRKRDVSQAQEDIKNSVD